ncbi:MAG: lipoyl(octanoyl) transferase LipB [Betaproteobacteria bacterium]|nr:lipoyl(octanoyl) transferase LipB [Betaproteobacteria bacterium]
MVAVLETEVNLRRLGRVEYAPTMEAMRAFTVRRGPDTPDEFWLLEHPPVYTLGQGADPAHGPDYSLHGEAAQIPLLRVDRGGEITYHGPGQVVLYALVDLARRSIQVREFVRMLEEAVIETLAAHGVRAERRPGAPGAYVAGAKIAALGLRVSRGRCYHGVALNVDCDLSPFAAIDPCGFRGLAVTSARALGIQADAASLGDKLAERLMGLLEQARA